MPLRESDVYRSRIITAPELAADGYSAKSVYLTCLLISTISSGIVTVQLPSSDASLLEVCDYQVDPLDIAKIYGSSGADGYYTVNQVLGDTTFSVNEPIADSTGGNVDFVYQSGSTLVGLDPIGMRDVTGNTVQQGIQQLDAIKISAAEHEILDQLIHFIDLGGPGHGFSPAAYKETTPFGSIFPTSVIWYYDATKAKKIFEELITWSGVVPSTVTYNMFGSDGSTIVQSATDTFTYVNNIFEATCTRTFTIP
jgi:hypothetical protein